MKTVILYKTKGGSTKEYADFINKKIDGSDIFDIDLFDNKLLENYDFVVIGSRVYMGKIQALDFLEKNWNILNTKQVYLFAVGLIDANAPESIASYKAIPEEIRSKIRFTKLPGKISMDGLSTFEKLIIKARKESKESKFNTHASLPIIDVVKKVKNN